VCVVLLALRLLLPGLATRRTDVAEKLPAEHGALSVVELESLSVFVWLYSSFLFLFPALLNGRYVFNVRESSCQHSEYPESVTVDLIKNAMKKRKEFFCISRTHSEGCELE
jgi:hypothetical protein